MSAGRTVEDILSSAKDALNKANALSDSTDKEIEKAAPPAPTPVVKHEYSHAPYSMAKSRPGLADELKAKGQMVEKARKALEH